MSKVTCKKPSAGRGRTLSHTQCSFLCHYCHYSPVIWGEPLLLVFQDSRPLPLWTLDQTFSRGPPQHRFLNHARWSLVDDRRGSHSVRDFFFSVTLHVLDLLLLLPRVFKWALLNLNPFPKKHVPIHFKFSNGETQIFSPISTSHPPAQNGTAWDSGVKESYI